MVHLTFHGPDTPTTQQQIQKLHADLGIEHVNVFKMKQPPVGAHPKVLRAYHMFRTLPDMWHDQFAVLLGEEENFGLMGPRGMHFDADAF
ncbi:MAG TPA: hypothetical protein PKV72_02555, partial [Candidatus Peribacteria bacterium]|nr:hypothetical protein [Candidatus Peribacteria bacterium]